MTDDYPYIVDVSHIKGYDLLILFDNGEERIMDFSDTFRIPAAIKYAGPDVFTKFDFDEQSIWWGDLNSSDSMEIGHDSIYRLSISIASAISSYSSKIVSLSMATVFDDRKLDVFARIKSQENELLHMHMRHKDAWYKVRLEDGIVYKPPNTPARIQKLLGSLAIKHRAKAIQLWNQWYPTMPADPLTGKFITRE